MTSNVFLLLQCFNGLNLNAFLPNHFVDIRVLNVSKSQAWKYIKPCKFERTIAVLRKKSKWTTFFCLNIFPGLTPNWIGIDELTSSKQFTDDDDFRLTIVYVFVFVHNVRLDFKNETGDYATAEVQMIRIH